MARVEIGLQAFVNDVVQHAEGVVIAHCSISSSWFYVNMRVWWVCTVTYLGTPHSTHVSFQRTIYIITDLASDRQFTSLLFSTASTQGVEYFMQSPSCSLFPSCYSRGGIVATFLSCVSHHRTNINIRRLVQQESYMGVCCLRHKLHWLRSLRI